MSEYLDLEQLTPRELEAWKRQPLPVCSAGVLPPSQDSDP